MNPDPEPIDVLTAALQEEIERGRILRDLLETPNMNQQLTQKDQAVLDIYKAYPRKINRPAAEKAIRKAMRDYDSDYLLIQTKRYAEFVSVVGDKKEFIPHPSTWFNQRRFLYENMWDHVPEFRMESIKAKLQVDLHYDKDNAGVRSLLDQLEAMSDNNS